MMKKLGQSVYRHIIATSGITDTLGLIAEDLSNQRFESRVTLHYSLHDTEPDYQVQLLGSSPQRQGRGGSRGNRGGRGRRRNRLGLAAF